MSNEIKELEAKLVEAEKQIVRSEKKAIDAQTKVYEMENFPEIAKRNMELEYDLKLARQFVSSKAFLNITPEQAYVLMKAGNDLGLSHLEALGSLYIVNGNIGFWGAGLVARLTKNGVKLSYTDESPEGVTVTAEYKGEKYSEKVIKTDPILQKSRAMTFASKNKMRYHGVRMLASFYFPHFLNGISVWEPDDFQAAQDVTKGDEVLALKERIEKTDDLQELKTIYAENKKVMTRPSNIDILTIYGNKVKNIENGFTN